MALTRNAAQCLDCGDVIESTHVHDFKMCSCGNVGVDGGLDYDRRLWSGQNWIDLNEYDDKE